MEFSVCHSKCHVRMYKIFNLKSRLVLTNLRSSMFANFVRPQWNSSKFINSASALRRVFGSTFFFFFFVKNYSITFKNAFKNSFDVKFIWCYRIFTALQLIKLSDFYPCQIQSCHCFFFFTYFPLVWCNF